MKLIRSIVHTIVDILLFIPRAIGRLIKKIV